MSKGERLLKPMQDKSRQKHVVLFGGSFNPPHIGHRQVLEHLVALKKFDEVWVVPSYAHPFEKGLIPFEHREKMCHLLIEGLDSLVKVLPIEEELKKNPSYTIDVVTELKQRFPNAQFHLAIGSDCKNDLPRWHRYEDLKRLVQCYFIPRFGIEPSPFAAISSSEVRMMIKNRKPCEAWVSPKVKKYIEDHKLYV